MKISKKATDEMLVVAYAKGRDEAFNLLLERYKDRLFSYIFYTVKNVELAEDIFQETFVKAVTTIRQGKYTENGKFAAWITRIAHNLVMDYYRKNKNQREVSNDDYEKDLFNDPEFSEKTIESKMVNNQVMNDVRDLIELLPENQRQVVYMRYYQQLSFKDIAEACDISINTALGRVRYAVLNLRKMANEYNLNLILD
jgi:RNA polymerase sigma-70 factor (ECF subfamily)